MTTLVLRMLPPTLRDVRRPQRMVARNVVAYRRQWLIIFSGFFEPLFYLLSMRVGLGSLIGTVKVGNRAVDQITDGFEVSHVPWVAL